MDIELLKVPDDVDRFHYWLRTVQESLYRLYGVDFSDNRILDTTIISHHSYDPETNKYTIEFIRPQDFYEEPTQQN